MTTQQAFADAVIQLATAEDDALVMHHETQVPDYWTFRAEGQAMSGMMCCARHSFDDFYKRTGILPDVWYKFCNQFLSPEARLVTRLYYACQEPSPLTWSPMDNGREDIFMTRHFWTEKEQSRTYAALLKNLSDRGLTTEPTRTYESDAIGIKTLGGVFDLPRSYRTLSLMTDELSTGTRFTADIPRVEKYGDSKPVLHMIANTAELKGKLHALAAEESNHKNQAIAYVLSELREGELVARRIGYMRVSVLEIAYGSLCGAFHSDMHYIVPNDLSSNESSSYDVDRLNWEAHYEHIVKPHPQLAALLA